MTVSVICTRAVDQNVDPPVVRFEFEGDGTSLVRFDPPETYVVDTAYNLSLSS